MAKKGKGSKKKQNKEDKKDTLPEVDKEHYEIQIADLNKKFSRIKQRCSELEKENVEVKKQYKTLEEESSDIIAFLKRSVAQKHEEIKVVTEKLQALQSTKATEKDKYQEQIQILEKDFKTMHDTFTAEVKLLSGQLSSLESFKNNRESMVKKLITLEEELRKKDEHHDLALRNNENKYILVKEKLSAYVEERLLKLSLDLQKQTQYTISETTRNVVKENIAINNELNLIIGSWQTIFDENEELHKYIRTLKQELEVVAEVKDSALKKNYVLNAIIDRLGVEKNKMLETFSNYEKYQNDIKEKLENCEQQMEQSNLNARRAEGLHKEILEEQDILRADYKKIKLHNYKLEKMIKKAVIKIQEVIGLQENKSSKTISKEVEFTLRRQLLHSLLDLFDTFNLFETGKPDEEDVMESSESEEDSNWIKKFPALNNCPFLNEKQKVK